jgi:glycosyltransferase involved in cell wall biosynthesis
MDPQPQSAELSGMSERSSAQRVVGGQDRLDQWEDWLKGETVTVVIPALNEAENLPHVLPRIPSWVSEVILVDDHCTDNTVAVARALLPSIRVVRNDDRPGKGNALQAGYAAAAGSLIVQVDADGSEAPEEIVSFVAALLAGADYAKGTRFIPGGGTSDMTHLRKWGNWVFVLMVRGLYGVRYTDLCYGYNAFRASALRRLSLDADGFEIEALINLRAAQAGLAIREVASFEAERVYGEGRLRTFPDGWRVLRTIWRERWRRPKLGMSEG